VPPEASRPLACGRSAVAEDERLDALRHVLAVEARLAVGIAARKPVRREQMLLEVRDASSDRVRDVGPVAATGGVLDQSLKREARVEAVDEVASPVGAVEPAAVGALRREDRLDRAIGRVREAVFAGGLRRPREEGGAGG